MRNEILGSDSYLLLQVKALGSQDFKTQAFILFLNLQLGYGIVGKAWLPLTSTQSHEGWPQSREGFARVFFTLGWQ